ncbi:hypothetical protein C4D60_Mb10t00120 [Musa balbisiana]|uniref:Uncharacterized protein n=1 Tax=Musa balbisiana TaxID=52838 RepID=A0A4S8ITJ7_MUSBA|nr:hypothetical protein C4D60_Mb10t00120 [Musa balbisiana]
MALMGFAEHRRFQDWAKPGTMGKQYFLGLEKGLGGSGDPAYPGGPFFNPLGFGKGWQITRGFEAEGGEEWEAGYVGHTGVFCAGACHRGLAISQPVGSLG